MKPNNHVMSLAHFLLATTILSFSAAKETIRKSSLTTSEDISNKHKHKHNGCPFFPATGSSPAYQQQSTGFDVAVTCDMETDGPPVCTFPNGETGVQGLMSNAMTPCLEDIRPDPFSCQELAEMWEEECEVKDSPLLKDGYRCGCMSDHVTNGDICQRTCAVCSPILVSKLGYVSGDPYELEQSTNLAIGKSLFQNPLPRIKCDPYDVAAVADTVRAMDSLDIPPTVRMGFHDACDYDKWAAIGGADGRIYNSPESWQAQSRTVNAGLLCPYKLMAKFKTTSMSPADAIQICSMVAVEKAGGPKFEDFNFEPGRAKAMGVTQDGMLPPPFGDASMLRDFFYRAGIDDTDIVALSGAHTLGGGQAEEGSGYVGDFTDSTEDFSNDYYQNLVKYENVTDNGCDYFSVPPAERATAGCHPTGDMEAGLQLPTDRAMMKDPIMREIVIKFAEDKQAFFDQYTKSVKKMSELGRDVSVVWCDYAYQPKSDA